MTWNRSERNNPPGCGCKIRVDGSFVTGNARSSWTLRLGPRGPGRKGDCASLRVDLRPEEGESRRCVGVAMLDSWFNSLYGMEEQGEEQGE